MELYFSSLGRFKTGGGRNAHFRLRYHGAGKPGKPGKPGYSIAEGGEAGSAFDL
jgi:hypothetical protein